MNDYNFFRHTPQPRPPRHRVAFVLGVVLGFLLALAWPARPAESPRKPRPLTEMWAEVIRQDVWRVTETDHVEPYFDPRTRERGHKFVFADATAGRRFVVRVTLRPE